MVVVRLKSDAIRRHLARRNLTQNGFALQHAGISAGYMSELMKGTKSPSPALRQRIQKALRAGCFDDLFEIVEDRGETNRGQ